MKHLKLFEAFKEEDIDAICRKYNIRNYTINEDGSINVDGNVDLKYKKLTKLPLKFKNVSGGFYCHDNQLTSLEGCPESVGGDFGEIKKSYEWSWLTAYALMLHPELVAQSRT